MGTTTDQDPSADGRMPGPWWDTVRHGGSVSTMSETNGAASNRRTRPDASSRLDSDDRDRLQEATGVGPVLADRFAAAYGDLATLVEDCVAVDRGEQTSVDDREEPLTRLTAVDGVAEARAKALAAAIVEDVAPLTPDDQFEAETLGTCAQCGDTLEPRRAGPSVNRIGRVGRTVRDCPSCGSFGVVVHGEHGTHSLTGLAYSGRRVAAVSEQPVGTDGSGMPLEGYVPGDGADEFETPREVWQPISIAVGGFDVDLAAGAEDTPIASEQIRSEDEWCEADPHGWLWCNPPWSSPEMDGSAKDKWLRRCRQQAQREAVDGAVVLLPADTSAHWWHDHVVHADAVCLIGPGRVSFRGADRNPTFATVLAVYGPVSDDLEEALASLGAVVTEWHDDRQTDLVGTEKSGPMSLPARCPERREHQTSDETVGDGGTVDAHVAWTEVVDDGDGGRRALLVVESERGEVAYDFGDQVGDLLTLNDPTGVRGTLAEAFGKRVLRRAGKTSVVSADGQSDYRSVEDALVAAVKLVRNEEIERTVAGQRETLGPERAATAAYHCLDEDPGQWAAEHPIRVLDALGVEHIHNSWRDYLPSSGCSKPREAIVALAKWAFESAIYREFDADEQDDEGEFATDGGVDSESEQVQCKDCGDRPATTRRQDGSLVCDQCSDVDDDPFAPDGGTVPALEQRLQDLDGIGSVGAADLVDEFEDERELCEWAAEARDDPTGRLDDRRGWGALRITRVAAAIDDSTCVRRSEDSGTDGSLERLLAARVSDDSPLCDWRGCGDEPREDGYCRRHARKSSRLRADGGVAADEGSDGTPASNDGDARTRTTTLVGPCPRDCDGTLQSTSPDSAVELECETCGHVVDEVQPGRRTEERRAVHRGLARAVEASLGTGPAAVTASQLLDYIDGQLSVSRVGIWLSELAGRDTNRLGDEPASRVFAVTRATDATPIRYLVSYQPGLEDAVIAANNSRGDPAIHQDRECEFAQQGNIRRAATEAEVIAYDRCSLCCSVEWDCHNCGDTFDNERNRDRHELLWCPERDTDTDGDGGEEA